MTVLEKKMLRGMIGPGGVNCRCCSPAPGSKALRSLLKLAVRRLSKFEIEEGLDDWDEENVSRTIRESLLIGEL